ncbi:hypothetical protein PENTCL1PPCAC_15781 [Pristionchus entomophagus]|uniref:Nuclear receptor n=1 Tax=Pristionchus entomophagus TaxID=358040 RepID=A0AAV5TH33_9BILA|nr:hypothetical protein PENTCL1PPCAC_15781 [Pristionchus entomophagus]
MDQIAAPSNSAVRKCLICGSRTSSCHLGVDACRACTVFYRRAKTRKLYACRSNTRRCGIEAEGGISCKRCRFDRFERILKESGAKEMLDFSQSEEREQSPVVAVPTAPTPVTSPFASSSSPSTEQLTSSVSSAVTPVSPSLRRERRLLEQCKLYYRILSSMRRTCELSSRPDAPHPLEMNEQECPIQPATFHALNRATKIALSAVLEFAGSMFPEFTQFSREEKWNLAVSFFYRYQGLDSCYRAEKMWPNDLDKSFGSFTCYWDHEAVEGFFDGCTQFDDNTIKEATKFMHQVIDLIGRPARLAISRANPDNEEFHAVLMILFWFTDGTQLRDEIVQIGERYRGAVLQELHAYYREELGMSDYATRVGELFMLILHFEKNKDIKEHFEICRMLGVFNDDTFMYQLQKDSAS